MEMLVDPNIDAAGNMLGGDILRKELLFDHTLEV